MKIIKTTDSKYLGREIENFEIGDTIELDEFEFEVVQMKQTATMTVLSNSNYIIKLK